MSLRILLALLSILLIGIFATQNNRFVVLEFLQYSWETTVGMVIIGSAVLGGLLVGVLGLVRQVGMSVQARDFRNKLRQAEKELQEAQQKIHELEQETSRLQGELSAVRSEEGRSPTSATQFPQDSS